MNIISRLIQWLESLDRKTVPATQAEPTSTEETTVTDTTDTTAAATDTAAAADTTTTDTAATESISTDVLDKLKTILVAAGHDVEDFFEEAVALAKKLAAKV